MTDGRSKLSRRDLLKWGAGAGAMALFGAGVPAPGRAAAEPSSPPLPQVPRRRLGKTDKTIPILLMGGAGKLDPKFDPKLAEALRFGVDYIDAAASYAGGTCEPAIGSFMQRMGQRGKVWITTKSEQHGPEAFAATVEASLENLQTDYVDMYFLHGLKDAYFLSPDLERTVAKLKEQGKIRHFGFSCHDGNVAELLHAAAKTPWVEAVMFRYNFRQYGDAELNAAMDACVAADVGLIAMKTQGSETSFADAWQSFQKVGKWSKHQAVLKAVWADERISAAVSHMDTFEKMKQNIAAALDTFELGQAEYEALERYAAETRALACDGCEHRCGAAVDAPARIGTTLRYLMYHDVYGEPDRARELFASLPAEAQRLSGIDFAPASAACPYGVDVASHMRRAAEVFHA